MHQKFLKKLKLKIKKFRNIIIFLLFLFKLAELMSILYNNIKTIYIT